MVSKREKLRIITQWIILLATISVFYIHFLAHYRASERAILSILLLLGIIVIWFQFRSGLFLIYSCMAAYNVAQAFAGLTDCGCFPVETSPMLTATLDGLCGLLFLKAPNVILWSILPLMVTGSFIVGWYGWLNPTQHQMNVNQPTVRSQYLGVEFDPNSYDDRIEVLVYRSDCAVCLAQKPIMFYQIMQNKINKSDIILEYDLDRPSISAIQGHWLASYETKKSIYDRFRFLPAPCILEVRAGKVVTVRAVTH
jgi:hypothetical protein